MINYFRHIILFNFTIVLSQQINNFTYYLTQDVYNITNFKYFECFDSSKDCSNAGICTKENDNCLCFEGYKTVFESPEDYYSSKPRCNYNLKYQLYAITLSLFPSFGFLHFYLGNYIVGYFQFTFFVLIFIFNLGVITNLSLKHVKKVSNNEIRGTFTLMCFVSFLSCLCFLWYIFDILMVLFNIYKDGNNVEIKALYTIQNT
jgi:hypothetical protein